MHIEGKFSEIYFSEKRKKKEGKGNEHNSVYGIVPFVHKSRMLYVYLHRISVEGNTRNE